ncbi:uncharacterized protein LOC110090183 [Pogona vitticeps]
MEERDLRRPEVKEESESGGRNLCVIQVGTVKELLTGMEIKKEANEGLRERWEAQWQEYLSKMQPPQFGQRDPPKWKGWSQDDALDLRASLKAVGEARWRSAGECRPPCLPKEAPKGLEASTDAKEKTPEADRATSSLEARRRSFRHFYYHEAEGPREVLNRLQALCRQWLEPERRTKEQILERVTLEQFLAILPLEMQNWVREQGPETCALAVALAEGFLCRLPGAESPGGKAAQTLEEVTISSSRLEHDSSSDSMELLLPVEIKQEKTGETDSQEPDKHIWTKEEKLTFPKSEKVAVPGISLTRDHPVSPQGPMVDERVTGHEGGNIRSSDQAEETKWQGFFHETCREGLQRSILQEGRLKQIRKKTVTEGGRTCSLSTALHKSRKAPKLYECTYCRKLCTNSAHLVIHERIHTGEKPHKCSECGKSFTQKGNLTSHKRIHMGERPHQCRNCGKSFSRRQQLMRHERIHSGEKPYKCSDCGKSFCRKDSLITHKGTHIREKPSDSCD